MYTTAKRFIKLLTMEKVGKELNGGKASLMHFW